LAFSPRRRVTIGYHASVNERPTRRLTERQAFDAMLLSLRAYGILDPCVLELYRHLNRTKSLPKHSPTRAGMFSAWTTCVDEALKRSRNARVIDA
jgi:hypothetical protein